ncbi:lamin tail domain-containing protein [Chloroflexi bacterium TSY]|nr:lamin tail domain-containing protein [Chloroflexi bacterium TSY]
MIAISAVILSSSAAHAQAENQVVAPTFSVARGLYNAPQILELTTITPNALIRYTLDGSPPSPSRGILYESPILVRTTTIVRALAYRADGSLLPSRHVTHSYIFIAGVASQQGIPVGYPAEWSAADADYEMDPEVVFDPVYRDLMVKALTEIPTLSIAADQNALFHSNIGIYRNPRNGGPEWERAISAELLYPDGRSGFQINAGLRIHGRASRQGKNTPKHSFRLLFKTQYGESKLRFPLFDGIDAGSMDTEPADATFIQAEHSKYDRATEFDTLVLRASYNRAWTHRDPDERASAQYMRDQWARETQSAMGQLAARGLFVHLYLNGLYWGIYNLHERPDAAFLATYFGGCEEEYDVMSAGDPHSGEEAAWARAVELAETDVANDATYRAMAQLIDFENLIDYMILNHYLGNTDWDRTNWYAGRRRSPLSRFRFFSWDAECTLYNLHEDVTNVINGNSPSRLFHKLMQNSEFRMLFVDRARLHLTNNGALTPQAAAMRHQALTNQIDKAVIAESARWGDYRRDVDSYREGPFALYTRNGYWESERRRLLTTFYPNRTAVLLQQYRTNGWLPRIDAPVANHIGGLVSADFSFSLQNRNSTGMLWYTLDGSDPRPPHNRGKPRGHTSGKQVHIYLRRSTHVKARVYHEGAWSALYEGKFIPKIENTTDLQITEIMYNPAEGDMYEFLEIANVGPEMVDLGGFVFADGISYSFSAGMHLDAGARLVIAKNPQLFAEQYGIESFNQHGYLGYLADGGERIVLNGRDANAVLTTDYTDKEPSLILADEAGYSLVRDTANDVIKPWQISTRRGGSPTVPDPENHYTSPVVINELLSHPASGETSYVELYNRSKNLVDISGWGLTDDPSRSVRYRFPHDTRIAGYSYRVVDLDQSTFLLDRQSEGVYLIALNDNGELTGYGHGFSLESSVVGQPYGRCTLPSDSLGHESHEHWTPLRSSTKGSANTKPLVGPVVISEIHYNPHMGPEYLELVNVSSRSVSLFDLSAPQVPWRIDGIGDFVLPSNLVLHPGETLLLTNGDPSVLRSTYAIPTDTQIIGPYPGRLRNNGERIALERPTERLPNGVVNFATVDVVQYGDEAPWPEATDGDGKSLVRIDVTQYGNTAQNWQASDANGGSPGRVENGSISMDGTESLDTKKSLTPFVKPDSEILLPLFMDKRPIPQRTACMR